MYIQVKMWKFHSSDTGKSRCKIAQEMKSKLDKLAHIIHVISSLEAGVNVNPAIDNFNLVLIVQFDNHEDMIIFHEHKEYKKIEELMANYIADSKVVEYEV